VITASTIQLVSVVLSLVALFYNPAGSVVSASTAGGSTSFTIPRTALEVAATTGAITLVLGFVVLWLYREAFRGLAVQDARFSTPSKLVLLEIIGLALIVVVGLAIFYVLLQAINCAAGAPITTACLPVGTLLGLVGLIFVLLIVVLIGLIGFLLGVWRLGTRYNNSLFNVAAILLIFPVLNLVAVILILLAAREVRSSIQSSTGGSFG